MQEHPYDEYPLSRLGLDPSQPLYDLNLAGEQGVPSPEMLSQLERSPEILLPDFGTQNYDIPTLQPFDLTSPGITYIPETSADPVLPNHDAYTHPYDVNVFGQSMDADAQLAHDVPTQAEITSSLYQGLGFSTLDVQQEVTDVDPLVPDLQDPDLTQQVQRPVDERPGDLDPSALLHNSPYYQQSFAKDYPEAWMDQRGINTTRSRRLSLLHNGLEQ